MNKKLIVIILLFLPITTPANIISNDDKNITKPLKKTAENHVVSEIKKIFQQQHIHGVLTIYDGKSINNYGNDTKRATIQYVPASTFKIVNALIALKNQKVTVKEIFKWDGQPRYLSSWNKDMNLQEAMKLSAVPIYQEIARRTGLAIMKKELYRLHYGNSKIGNDVTKFWLDGPLKISPAEQAQFIYKLATKQLPIDKTIQNEVAAMLLIKQTANIKIYAKSGLANINGERIGWYVGWVENANGKIKTFALNIAISDDKTMSKRESLTLQCLAKLKII
ncbi:class D beta-lactamase [Arsenophonus nasoniae]|uniref:Beta-lactamase n=1 Tax=Arsenophonus nasoniae TaxID=638 RepID=D2U3B1_9GAMM|nr:class D beta-lactamase [Arsenophonus nasoniae]QBY41581.1 Beta-lactamase OXA-133 [Arsenophonus nasoniae]WGM05786.1 class D beta-lactamase [Arsenophonus nasoniae]WGM10797.1 class D beta-lactamase [Arsenophonus nasoniae]WGM15504.1 class D beta-lactamase [Arsenophonus nasoniae]CBA75767.1 beta-lactamase [Arsenophonus nasoniae]